jgi:hypothetical protein
MKNSIVPMTKNLQELYRLVGNLEKQYKENYLSLEQRKFQDDKLNFVLRNLCKNKKEDRVTIVCESDKFETTIFTIKNCVYKNLLWDIIEEGFSSDERIIYMDFESHYFEVLLEIIRNKQIKTQDSDMINKIDKELKSFKEECQNQEDKENNDVKMITSFKNSKPILQVYDKEKLKFSSNLRDSIKRFFYRDWETIFEEFNIIDN